MAESENITNPIQHENSSVYFVMNPEDWLVKIGLTVDIRKRLSSLQTGNAAKLQLIRLVDGDARLEKWLHKRFAEYHVRGEWFKYRAEMLTVIMPDFIAPIEQERKARFKNAGAQLANAKQLGLLTPDEIELIKDALR